MMKMILFLGFLLAGWTFGIASSPAFEEDVFKTSRGDLKIAFIGHGTLMFSFAGKIVHIDPVAEYADYSRLPKADIILVTHEHSDHLDPAAVELLRKSGTDLAVTAKCAGRVKNGQVVKNGETKTFQGISIDAVPAYNIVNTRGPGQPFHPKGDGNGYILAFGDKRVYVAGDTENTPEMKELKNIDIAFLPMNLPYTMTPDMVADAAKAFRPKVLYPYHYGNTETSKLIDLLKAEKDIEVRIRNLR